ncbi:hypothetical protein HYY74_01435 [Candidatus Woesearchaeota archaeon]|nr:hypothetical protein [Candidatus Woesearchaeota archaeon]
MKGKKGIELSINFVVIIVLSVVMLGFGLTLLYKSVGSAWQSVESIGGCDDSAVNDLLGSQRIAICPSTIEKAHRSKAYTAYVGVKNTGTAAMDFKVALRAESGVDPQGQKIPDSYMANNRVIFTFEKDDNNFPLQPNERKIMPVIAKIPSNTKPGTYYIGMNVCSCTSAFPDNCRYTLTNPDCTVDSMTVKVV